MPGRRQCSVNTVGLVPHLISRKSKVRLVSYSYNKLINLHFWYLSLIKQHKPIYKVIRLQIRLPKIAILRPQTTPHCSDMLLKPIRTSSERASTM
jgi:hypothetical protein